MFPSFLGTYLQVVEHPRAEVSGHVILEHHLNPLASAQTRDAQEGERRDDFPDPLHGETVALLAITAKCPPLAWLVSQSLNRCCLDQVNLSVCYSVVELLDHVHSPPSLLRD